MTNIEIKVAVPAEGPVQIETTFNEGNVDEQAFAAFLANWLCVFADQMNEHRYPGERVESVLRRMIQ